MKGFIALVSVLIITGVFIVSIYWITQSGIASTLFAVRRIRANFLTDDCAEEALMRLCSDPNYSGNETFLISNKECQVLPFEDLGGEARLVRVQSSVNGKTKKIRIEVGTMTPKISINSWTEVPDF